MNPTQKERIEALENSHRTIHKKLDALVGTVAPSAASPLLLDARGREVVTGVSTAASSDPNAEMFRVAMAHMSRPPAPPEPKTDWMPLVTAVVPLLLAKLLDKPDPIAQISALKELAAGDEDPMMNMMTAMMPLMMKRMEQSKDNEKGGMSEEDIAASVAKALSGISPAVLRGIAGGKAQANGEGGSS